MIPLDHCWCPNILWVNTIWCRKQNAGQIKSFVDDSTRTGYCKHGSSLCATTCWGSSFVRRFVSNLFSPPNTELFTKPHTLIGIFPNKTPKNIFLPCRHSLPLPSHTPRYHIAWAPNHLVLLLCQKPALCNYPQKHCKPRGMCLQTSTLLCMKSVLLYPSHWETPSPFLCACVLFKI